MKSDFILYKENSNKPIIVNEKSNAELLQRCQDNWYHRLEIKYLETKKTIDANDNIYEKEKLLLGNIKIGEYEINAVPVLAHKDGQGTSNLFGISALKRLGSVFIIDFQNNNLTVIK